MTAPRRMPPDTALGPDWEDLRTLLAVAQSGSASAAALRLGVAHTTVGRRLRSLEQRLGYPLTENDGSATALTEAGSLVAEEAARMEEVVRTISRRLSGVSKDLSGTLRLYVTEGLGTLWLIPAMRQFQDAHPRLCINWLTANTVAPDLEQGVDLALTWREPTAPFVVRRRLGTIAYSLYCTTAYVSRYGMPRGPEDLSSHRLMTFNGYALNPDLSAWNELLLTYPPALTLESTVSASAAMLGEGYLTLLPDYVTSLTAVDFVRVPFPFDIQITGWLAYHEDRRHMGALRAVAAEINRLVAGAPDIWRRG